MMLRKCLLFAMLLAAVAAHAKFVPDPIVQYKIDARLDAKAKTLQGHEVIQWRNHTADTIPDLQFHLYFNAFKNNLSTFFREGGANGRFGKFRGDADSWGYLMVQSIKVDGEELTSKMQFIQPDDGNPDDLTVMRVPLTKPIPANGRVAIEIVWTLKLPHVFARTGFHDNFFLLAQWFPKPGVYEGPGDRHREKGGWNCHQFHISTEFYADYGTYDVNLTVPSDFEIAASGEERSTRQNSDGTTTHEFYQEDIHDFAWTTQPKSQVRKIVRTFKADEQVTPSEIAEWSRKEAVPPEEIKLKDVKVTLFIQRDHDAQVDRHFKACFAAIKWYGIWYGKYPYDVVTFVDPPYGGRGAGGMEYPTFFTAGTDYWTGEHRQSPEGVIVHEFGHQFWYGLVGNNEFEEAWLDEGFNTYSTGKVLEKAYGPAYSYEKVFGMYIPADGWLELPVPRYPWKGVGGVPIGQYWEWVPEYQWQPTSRYWREASTDAMERYAWLDLNRPSYGVQAYDKPALTLRTLEGLLGEAWPKVIRTYQLRFRFKHPDAIDFMDTVKEVSGRDMKWFFDQTLYGTGRLDYSVSFTNSKPRKDGFFEENGKPVLVKAPDDDTDDDDTGPVESEVLVRRLGEMTFPVTVRVKFSDGSEAREQWDGQYRWQKFKYIGRPKIVQAEVDPDRLWKLEVPRTNNSALKEPVALAPEKWYLRWVVWIENVLMGFSFFS